MDDTTFRAAIENEAVVLGARTQLFSRALVEIYGQLDYDFVWLDYEHGGPSPWDSREFEDLTRAAELAEIDLLVRIPPDDGAGDSLIRKVLDTGVRNVLVPRVEDADDVREAVAASRFVYDGQPGGRGAANWRSRRYGTAPDYFREEDKGVCVGAMIETAAAYRNLDEILDVPELGFVFVGPCDLSIQLGHPGEPDHPMVESAVSEVVEKSLESGVPVGGIAHDPRAARDLIESGYQIVRLGGDLDAVREVLDGRRSRLETLRTDG